MEDKIQELKEAVARLEGDASETFRKIDALRADMEASAANEIDPPLHFPMDETVGGVPSDADYEYQVYQRKADVDEEQVYGFDWVRAHG